MSIVILTIGIPGAGKSTWVENFTKKRKFTVISTDEIRKELTGVEQCVNPSQNDMIHDEARKRVAKLINNPENYGGNNGMGPAIIVDSTNVDVTEWLKYKELRPRFLVAKVFNVTPEEAMEHQKSRERQVPLDILKWKWDTLQENKKYLDKIFNFILGETDLPFT